MNRNTVSTALLFMLRAFGVLGAAMLLLAAWVTQPTFGGGGAGKGEAVNAERLREHVDRLVAGFPRRHFFRPETLDRAAQYIEGVFENAGARVESQFYEVDGQPYRNVIAHFGPAEGQPLIIGAHYDAEEHTPGADDNASGVAGLLELAAALGRRPPAVPVQLVAYTLEEPPHFRTGDMGSRRHAALIAQEKYPPRLVLVLEMIGYFDDHPASQSYPFPGMAWLYPDRGNFIALVGEFSSPRPVRMAKRIIEAATPLPVHSINAPSWLPGIDFSDHASYWMHGLPAIMITDTAFYRNANYHRSGDLPDTLDYRRMAQVIQGVLAVVRRFDQEDTNL